MKLWSKTKADAVPVAGPKHPGVRQALDGSSAVVAMETAASDAAWQVIARSPQADDAPRPAP